MTANTHRIPCAADNIFLLLFICLYLFCNLSTCDGGFIERWKKKKKKNSIRLGPGMMSNHLERKECFPKRTFESIYAYTFYENIRHESRFFFSLINFKKINLLRKKERISCNENWTSIHLAIEIWTKHIMSINVTKKKQKSFPIFINDQDHLNGQTTNLNA